MGIHWYVAGKGRLQCVPRAGEGVDEWTRRQRYQESDWAKSQKKNRQIGLRLTEK